MSPYTPNIASHSGHTTDERPAIRANPESMPSADSSASSASKSNPPAEHVTYEFESLLSCYRILLPPFAVLPVRFIVSCQPPSRLPVFLQSELMMATQTLNYVTTPRCSQNSIYAFRIRTPQIAGSAEPAPHNPTRVATAPPLGSRSDFAVAGYSVAPHCAVRSALDPGCPARSVLDPGCVRSALASRCPVRSASVVLLH